MVSGELAAVPKSPRRQKWYGAIASWKGPHGVVQVELLVRDAERRGARLRLPEPVLRLAQTEYEQRYGTGQDYERMQERGGLGVLEVVALLADYVERLGGKPTEPRASVTARLNTVDEPT
jgi:hypothetical protein